MKKLFALAAAALATASVTGQVVVFSDDFNRESLGQTWSVTVTSGDGDARIASNMAELTNDKTGIDRAAGRVYATTPTSSFASPYNLVLSSNPGAVTWTFNMRQVRSSLGGFDTTDYGAAFVLGATGGDLMAADGYAVVIGQTGLLDPVRLVKFSGGLSLNSHLTDIILALAPLDDPENHYMSLNVSYEPAGNTWSFYGRDDGTIGFADPAGAGLVSLGTAADSDYTGASLSHMGFLWNYNTADDQTAYFDNVTVSVVPEPSQIALATGLLLLMLAAWRASAIRRIV